MKKVYEDILETNKYREPLDHSHSLDMLSGHILGAIGIRGDIPSTENRSTIITRSIHANAELMAMETNTTCEKKELEEIDDTIRALKRRQTDIRRKVLHRLISAARGSLVDSGVNPWK